MQPARLPAANTHISILDFIRGVAILAVFSYHAVGTSFGMWFFPFDGLFPAFHEFPATVVVLFPAFLGGLGVALFFAVSGFCIHLSHRRSQESDYSKFFFRRFFRIYPPYLFALLLFFFARPDLRSGNPLQAGRQLVAHLLLLNNLYAPAFFSINSSFWTIAVEAQLYVLYPVLRSFTDRFGWPRTIVALLLLELTLRTILINNGFSNPVLAVPGITLAFWFSWSIGAYVAEAYLNAEKPWLFRLPMWIFLALALTTCLVGPLTAYCFPAYALLTSAFVFKRLNQEPQVNRGPFELSYRVICLVGVLSYSLYLIHEPLLGTLHNFLAKSELLSKHGPLLNVFGCLLACPPIILLSWMMYKWVELPSIDLGKRAWRIVSRVRPIFPKGPVEA